MFLYRIHLNPLCKDARRDLADPYQMHSTLCRAFFPEGKKCPPGGLLWRLEPETDPKGRARVLIQSSTKPDWTRLNTSSWLAKAEPGIDLVDKLRLTTIQKGQQFRFRLRANPCKKIQGKRRALLKEKEQIFWLARKGKQHGFLFPQIKAEDYFESLQSPADFAFNNISVTQQQLLHGLQHNGNKIFVNAVLFEGKLTVTDPEKFRAALQKGIGHAKVMGLGLFSVIPFID